MNFVVYSINNKQTGKVCWHGYLFTRRSRDYFDNMTDKDIKQFLESIDFSPNYFEVNFGHFRTLKKLRKQFFKAIKRY